jgi:hypothetical protein
MNQAGFYDVFSRSARFQTVVIDQNPLRLYLVENLQEEPDVVFRFSRAIASQYLNWRYPKIGFESRNK